MAITSCVIETFHQRSGIGVVMLRAFPYVVFCAAFFFWRRKAYRKIANSIAKGWWILDSIAAGFALLLNQLVTHKIMIFKASKEEYFLTFYLVGLSVLVYVGVFMLLNYMYRENQYQTEKQYYRMREKLIKSELSAQEEKVEIAKQNRHDLCHHNNIILQLLEQNDTQKAKEYLRAYQENLTNFSKENYCKNYVVNAILKNYAAKAQQENITIQITADIPNEMKIPPVALCSVVSNALENAVEAATQCEHGWIQFHAAVFQGMLKLEIENSCPGAVLFQNGIPQATKKGSEGTGTKSIVQIAEQNGGMAKFLQEKDVFITRILLKNGN